MASCSDGGGACSSSVGAVATTSGSSANNDHSMITMAEQYDLDGAASSSQFPKESDSLRPKDDEDDEGHLNDADGSGAICGDGGVLPGITDPMTCLDEECHIKPPTPCPPVVDLRGREVIFAIAVFFLFSVSVGLIVILATTKLSDGKNKGAAADGGQTKSGLVSDEKDASRLCLTKECLKRAAYMLDTMDRSADPCTDFWQYSCGGWLAKATIPPFAKSWSVDHEIDVRIKADIRRKVEAPVVKDTPESVDRKVKVLYRKCMDLDAIEELGSRPVLDIVNSMGGWALNADWNVGEKSGLWNLQHVVEELHFTYWRDSFFVLWVGADHKNSDTNVIQIDQAGIGMESPSAYFQNDSDHSIQKYKQFMREIAQLFTQSQQDVEEFVETTFNFEKQLAGIMVPMEHESRRDPDAMYNPLTVAELQQLSPRINWLRFLRRNFSDVTPSTTVVVTNKDYMSNMSTLIETSRQKTLNNHLMWRLASNFANILSKPFREAALRFEGKAKGNGGEESRWKTCQDVLNEWLGMAVGSLYIKDNFPSESRDDVIDIISNVRQRFKRRLQQIDWMDKPTKEHAIEKVERMMYKIGYPSFLLNGEQVERFYKNFHINENDTFFQSNLNGIYYEIRKMVDKLKKSPSKEEWEMNPQAVNAYYAATENQMVFPAGILQLPYYNSGLPRYVNFGSIGSTIGHEMIHGFDVFGGLYDASGNLNRWWSDTSWANFENRTRCIADFYSSFSLNGFPINGDITLGENIADIGGITQAFEAYKLLEDKIGVEKLMPGLHLNNYQVFFLAYGQNWCIKRTLESIREVTEPGNSHAPGQIRVNATLSQVPAFLETFNCPKSSPMYPNQKCSVW